MIVDDEILVLEYLAEMIKELGVDIVGTFTSSRKALEKIPELSPDLIFLDIEMPGINGIELAIELSDQLSGTNIVFVTAYNQYAIEAFRLNALHYILKPPAKEDIVEAIARGTFKKDAQEKVVHHRIEIHVLGTVDIVEGEASLITWPTQKAEELFALFMIYRKNDLNKWDIIEKLWPNSDNEKLEHLLYTTIYRMKKSLEEAGIAFQLKNSLGYYTFSIENVCYDVDELEGIYEQTQGEDWEEDAVKVSLFQLYQGNLFGSRDYLWGEPAKYASQNMFETICNRLICAYEKKNEKEKAEEVRIKMAEKLCMFDS
ncbi:MAG: LytR/AlgR family response regulator transcription factor [Velocimicrobium sp.]